MQLDYGPVTRFGSLYLAYYYSRRVAILMAHVLFGNVLRCHMPVIWHLEVTMPDPDIAGIGRLVVFLVFLPAMYVWHGYGILVVSSVTHENHPAAGSSHNHLPHHFPHLERIRFLQSPNSQPG